MQQKTVSYTVSIPVIQVSTPYGLNVEFYNVIGEVVSTSYYVTRINVVDNLII